MNYVVLKPNFAEQPPIKQTELLEQELCSPITIKISNFPFKGYVSADAHINIYAIKSFTLVIKNSETKNLDTVSVSEGSTVVIAQHSRFRIQGNTVVHITTITPRVFTLTRHESV